MLNKTDVTSSFTPLTPGCSRKVDLALDPTRKRNVLKIYVTGTVGGNLRRDSDTFKFK